jgi:hypothetical protein
MPRQTWSSLPMVWQVYHNILQTPVGQMKRLLAPVFGTSAEISTTVSCLIFWLEFKLQVQNMTVFWDVLWSLVEIYQCVRGTYCLLHLGSNGGIKHLWFVSKHLLDYMAQHPKRQSLYLPLLKPLNLIYKFRVLSLNHANSINSTVLCATPSLQVQHSSKTPRYHKKCSTQWHDKEYFWNNKQNYSCS